MATSIEWTDVTDNIIVAESGGWWCRKISPGCANCYAAKLNQSPFYGGNKLPYTGEAPRLKLRLEILAGWARQTKPKRHFVASMTDVFGEWVRPQWSFEMLDAMAAAPRQTFQVLTKRPDIAALRIHAWLDLRSLTILPPNIWIGTSVEDAPRKTRIDILRTIPAHVRFLSCEPLLADLGTLDLLGIHWLIAGGESGPKARPVHSEWIISLRDQCQAARVPFLFKQWGEWVPAGQLPTYAPADHPVFSGKVRFENGCYRIGKKQAGRHLDGREWNEFPWARH